VQRKQRAEMPDPISKYKAARNADPMFRNGKKQPPEWEMWETGERRKLGQPQALDRGKLSNSQQHEIQVALGHVEGHAR